MLPKDRISIMFLSHWCLFTCSCCHFSALFCSTPWFTFTQTPPPNDIISPGAMLPVILSVTAGVNIYCSQHRLITTRVVVSSNCTYRNCVWHFLFLWRVLRPRVEQSCKDEMVPICCSSGCCLFFRSAPTGTSIAANSSVSFQRYRFDFGLVVCWDGDDTPSFPNMLFPCSKGQLVTSSFQRRYGKQQQPQREQSR